MLLCNQATTDWSWLLKKVLEWLDKSLSHLLLPYDHIREVHMSCHLSLFPLSLLQPYLAPAFWDNRIETEFRVAICKVVISHVFWSQPTFCSEEVLVIRRQGKYRMTHISGIIYIFIDGKTETLGDILKKCIYNWVDTTYRPLRILKDTNIDLEDLKIFYDILNSGVPRSCLPSRSSQIWWMKPSLWKA